VTQKNQVMFYHANQTSAVVVLFDLLKKSLKNNKKCLVCCDTLENAKGISDDLWIFQSDFILPHGIINEAMPDKQPVLLTDNTDNINQSDYIFFIGHTLIKDTECFERSIVIFDNHSEVIKSYMREQFKALKNNQAVMVTYNQI
jgi:DNA polymerase III subunit chi